MQLCDFWWEDARKPHPGKKLLSERLGISVRQVQRYIAELEQAGLVRRIERRAAHGGKMTNTYDLSGLVEKMKKLEPDFRRVEEDVKAGAEGRGEARVQGGPEAGRNGGLRRKRHTPENAEPRAHTLRQRRVRG